MTTTSESTARWRSALVATLVERGALTDPAWRDAFTAVPREAFVPRFARREQDRQLVYYDHHDQAAGFFTAVYSDCSLLTRFNSAGIATSSSTQPSLMAIMLERLDVHDRDTVLEIGTGTGYNAALLAHRLGEEAVTTIDIDPNAAADAERALVRTGYQPAIRCGDGAAGVPTRAPFDRIIATCGVPRIPRAWIDQTRPGGKILANVSFGLVLLTVTADDVAAGRFDTEPAAFMQLRHELDDTVPLMTEVLALVNDDGNTRPTTIPDDLNHAVVEFLTALILPEVHRTILYIDPATHVPIPLS